MTTDTQAAVAAALMQAAEKAFNVIANYPLRTMLTNTDNATMMELAILAMIPADAMAALEAVKAEARRDGMMEAAGILYQRKLQMEAMLEQSIWAVTEKMNDAAREELDIARNAILAAMEAKP